MSSLRHVVCVLFGDRVDEALEPGWLRYIHDPLKSSGLARITRIDLDLDQGTGRMSDGETLPITTWAFATLGPDLVVVTCIDRIHDEGMMVGTYQRIRECLVGSEVPIISFHPDTVSSNDVVMADTFLAICDRIVAIDRSRPPVSAQHPDRWLCLFTPVDPAMLCEPSRAIREIPLSFIGHLDRAERRYWIERCRRLRIPLEAFDGAGAWRPRMDYAALVRRSAFTLNIGSHPWDPHLKGRLFDATASGSGVLDLHFPGTMTPDRFVPYEEYVPFRNPEELSRLWQQICADPEWAQAVAQAGCRRTRRCYLGVHFWTAVFEELGI